MADTAISITAGTGTNVDTRTEATNGNHRQVIVIGDPSTNAGVAPVDATNGLSVDVKASALPTGAATSAKQDTGNTSLSSIDGKLPALGQALAAASVPVVIASNQSAIPVSGTFYQATQPVSGNLGADLRVGGADVTTSNPVSIQPPASGHLHIDGDGTAGAPAAGVVTVQGITSMTALKVDGSAVTQPVSGTFYQATQPVSLATLPALVAGSALVGKVSIDQVTANANEVVTKTGSVTAATLSAETTKVIGTVNVAAGQTIAVTNAGTFATQATLQTSSNAIGKLAANSGVDIGDVDVTSIAAGTNNIGQVCVAPQTANGLSVFNATSSDGATALTSTAQAIKASAGQVYGWYIYNPNTSAQFVQFYNTAAASVTVGTTNPLFMLTIPASSAANVEFTNGITFSNAGFSCAATSTAGGNGAPTSALDAVIFYK